MTQPSHERRKASRIPGFTGMMLMWPCTKAPPGWMICDGREISRRCRLGRLLVQDGCRWGDGNGHTTVNLPNLSYRFPLGQGTHPEGDTFEIGMTGGSHTQTLHPDQLPPHTHLYSAPTRINGVQEGEIIAFPTGMTPQQTTLTGKGRPISLLPPYAVVAIIIRI